MKLIIVFLSLIFCFTDCSSQNQTQFDSNELHPKSAKYRGGLDSLNVYVKTHLKYPLSAKRDSIEGKVIVQFFVDTTGFVSDVTVIQSVRLDIDKEAVRVISEMPKWVGTNVRVKYKLPINFFIQKGKD
jgi:TonB family protein